MQRYLGSKCRVIHYTRERFRRSHGAIQTYEKSSAEGDRAKRPKGDQPGRHVKSRMSPRRCSSTKRSSTKAVQCPPTECVGARDRSGPRDRCRSPGRQHRGEKRQGERSKHSRSPHEVTRRGRRSLQTSRHREQRAAQTTRRLRDASNRKREQRNSCMIGVFISNFSLRLRATKRPRRSNSSGRDLRSFAAEQRCYRFFGRSFKKCVDQVAQSRAPGDVT